MNTIDLILVVAHFVLLGLAFVPMTILFMESVKKSLISLAITFGFSIVDYVFIWILIQIASNNIGFVESFFKNLQTELSNAADVHGCVAMMLTLVMSTVLSWYLYYQFKEKNSNPDQIRGAEMQSLKAATKTIKKTGIPKIPLTIGGVPIPLGLETLSIILFGMLGTGKTLAILKLNELFGERGIGFIAHDANWDIYNKTAGDSDIILSGTSRKSVAYSYFSEIRGKVDCKKIAKAIIPDDKGENVVFNKFAQQLLSDVFLQSFRKKKTKNKDLLHICVFADIPELAEYLSGTSSQRLFGKGNEKLLSNALAVLSLYLQPVQLLNPEADHTSFSLRKWLKKRRKSQSLYMPYDDFTADITEPLRRSWIQILLLESLSMKPDKTRRIPFVIDELSSAGYLEGLDRAIARGRKYGLYFILGCQNVSQIFDIYGKYKAQSILGCIGHWLLLRTPDHETGEYLSKTIGDREIEREQRSYNSGNESVTTQYQRQIERLVLPSELAQLPDRHGYLNISGMGWTKVVIPIAKGDKKEKRQAAVKKIQSPPNKFAPKSLQKMVNQPVRNPAAPNQEVPQKAAKQASQQRKPIQRPAVKSANQKSLDEV